MDSISPQIARRFILGLQGLWPGRRWQGKEGIARAIQQSEAIQIDPVVVLEQSHHLALWGRVLDFSAEDLDSLLYEERRFFDYGGALNIYPMHELPHWAQVMQKIKSVTRWKDFAAANPKLLDEVRAAVRENGPTRKRDLGGKQVQSYRGNRDTGVALYYIWLVGEFMSHSRVGKERVYELSERIAPKKFRLRSSANQANNFLFRKAISTLGLANKSQLRAHVKEYLLPGATKKDLESAIADLLEKEKLHAVQIEGNKSVYYYLEEHKDILHALIAESIPKDWQPIGNSTSQEVTFLSPLERVSARGRAKELFDFDYIWEIYKPAEKRRYGPYTLPILFGDQLVARIDMKMDRADGTLIIKGFWPENQHKLNRKFHLAMNKGLQRLMFFLGANNLSADQLPAKSFLRKIAEELS